VIINVITNTEQTIYSIIEEVGNVERDYSINLNKNNDTLNLREDPQILKNLIILESLDLGTYNANYKKISYIIHPNGLFFYLLTNYSLEYTYGFCEFFLY
jgi:hypothetical protein